MGAVYFSQMRGPSAAVPRGLWLGLGALVLLAHLLALRQLEIGLASDAPLQGKVFATRILAPAVPPGPVPAAVPAPVARPRAHQADPAPAAVPPVPATVAQAEATPVVAAPSAAASAAQVAAGSAPAPPVESLPPPAPPSGPVEPAAPAGQPVSVAVGGAPAVAAPAAAPSSTTGAAEARTLAVPGSARLRFHAQGMSRSMEYHARGELSWQHDGRRYESRLEFGAFLIGSRVRTSVGQLGTEGLMPQRFSDKFRSELAAHFDRERGRVVFSGNSPEAALQAGAQDQLSVFIQLASLLGGEPGRWSTGSILTMQTAGPRAAETWSFRVGERERLQLPGGAQDTVRLSLLPRRDYEQKVDLWMAPALAWLPARIRITQANGDFIDLQWRESVPP